MTTLTRQLPMSASAGRSFWPFHVGAIADVVVGLDLVAFSDPIARLILPHQPTILGFSCAAILQALGAFLILFAIETFVVVRAQGTLARFRSWIVVANWATVVVAALTLAVWHAAFSPAGVAAVSIVATALAVLAALQQRVLRS